MRAAVAGAPVRRGRAWTARPRPPACSTRSGRPTSSCCRRATPSSRSASSSACRGAGRPARHRGPGRRRLPAHRRAAGARARRRVPAAIGVESTTAGGGRPLRRLPGRLARRPGRRRTPRSARATRRGVRTARCSCTTCGHGRGSPAPPSTSPLGLRARDASPPARRGPARSPGCRRSRAGRRPGPAARRRVAAGRRVRVRAGDCLVVSSKVVSKALGLDRRAGDRAVGRRSATRGGSSPSGPRRAARPGSSRRWPGRSWPPPASTPPTPARRGRCCCSRGTPTPTAARLREAVLAAAPRTAGTPFGVVLTDTAGRPGGPA